MSAFVSIATVAAVVVQPQAVRQRLQQRQQRQVAEEEADDARRQPDVDLVSAGVIALSAVAPSFAIALGLGTGYVFCMVAPLFGISLLWEHSARPRPSRDLWINVALCWR